MKFAFPEYNSSDEDDLISLASSFTSESSGGPSKSSRPALSTFGRNIKNYIASSSESEPDLVDEEDELKSTDVIVIGTTPSKSKSSKSRKSKGKMRAAAPAASWRQVQSMKDLLSDTHSQHLDSAWNQVIDDMALKEGQRIARERFGNLNAVLDDTRAQIREERGMKDAGEADEIARMLSSMAIQHRREEEEAAKKFAERERKLWADIDAAIRLAEENDLRRRQAIEDAAAKKQADAEKSAKAAAEMEELKAKDRRMQAEKLAREQSERQHREQAEATRVQDERNKVEQAAAVAEAAKSAASSLWVNWTQEQKRIKMDVVEVIKADGRGKLRTGMRLITRGLGQVVNTRESVRKLADDICEILNPHLPSPPSPGSPTTLSSPKPYLYLLSHTSKALIKQAENEIAAKSEAAYPLAAIVFSLLLRGHAAFGTILFARLNKKCPWVIPFYPTRQPNQSRAEYEKSTGQGTDESTGDYIIRMGGILTLYFSILQTPLTPILSTIPAPPTPDQLVSLIPPPLRLPSAWTWISEICKEPLRKTPAAAHLMNVWVGIVSPELAKVYGQNQVSKILRAIKEEGVNGGLVKGDTESARQQLGLVIEQWRAGVWPKGRSWE